MDLVSVQIFLNRLSAENAKMALEANGIQSMISADDCGGVRPELSMQQGVLLMVRKEDAQKAKEILQSLEEQHSESHATHHHSQGFLTKLRAWLTGK